MMTEILIIKSCSENPTWVNTNIYKDGIKLTDVDEFKYILRVDKGSFLELRRNLTVNVECFSQEYYDEDDGDKIIMINFNNWKQYLEELRNEDSILLYK